MAQYDDLNVRRIAVVGVLSIIITAVTALAVQVIFYSMASYNDAQKQADSNYRRQNDILSAQAEQVGSYAVDSDTANITIPVEEAMKTMVAEIESSGAEPSDSQTHEPKDET
ncbi:MAG: hypothetical protein AAF989_02710 [Planctomycetota bacterium]